MARSFNGLSNQQFPKLMAALQKAHDAEWNTQWRLGDIVRAEIGDGPGPGEYDETLDRLRAAAAEAEALGLDDDERYSWQYLKQLRDMAATFPPETRIETLSWSTHQEAGSPEVLRSIIKQAKARKEKVTRLYIRSIRRAKFRALDLQHERLHRAVTISGGKSPVSVPPRPVQGAPMEVEEIDRLMPAAPLLEVGREARRQVDMFRRAFEKVELSEIDSAYVDVVLEDILTAMNVLQSIANELKPRATKGGRGRLSVA